MRPDGRKTAFDLLCRQERAGSYSNLMLDEVLKERGLDSREAAPATRLFYGVLERRVTLDYVLAAHLRQPLKKLKPQVLTLLRMGAYQLLYLTKIPQSAVVNETVKLAKASGCGFAGGLINGVLRNVVRVPVTYEQIKDPLERLSAEYSCPRWLVELWVSSYGEENAKAILKSAFGRPPLHIRVNTAKTSDEELTRLLENEGVTAVKAAAPHSLALDNTGAVEQLVCFQKGLFHVQDLASQLCAIALDPKPGESLLDLCAAPGGKSFTCAELMEDRGRVTAMDLHEHRVRLIIDGARRLGLRSISAQTGDASIYQKELGFFDKILCDVPCSGLGILRRKPEIRYKNPLELDNLPVLQYRILCTASRYCAPGGRLVYSTCTLNPRENEAVVARFLKEQPAFTECNALPELSQRGPGPGISLMPHVHGTDGFYIAVLQRTR